MSSVRRIGPRRLSAALIGFVSLGLLASAALVRPTVAAALSPTLTVRARYLASDHNIAFSGTALPKGGRMLAVLEFRLEKESGGAWRPITVWMALITGIGAHWRTNGRYASQLMAMNEPVPAGRLRVEMRVADNTGLASVAYSNPVVVP